jgi:hypothetical protein
MVVRWTLFSTNLLCQVHSTLPYRKAPSQKHYGFIFSVAKRETQEKTYYSEKSDTDVTCHHHAGLSVCGMCCQWSPSKGLGASDIA